MSNGVKGKEKDNKFFTIEFFGVTLIIFSFLLLVCLLFGSSVLFELGEEIKFSLLGAFGYFAYPFLLSLNVVGFMMLLGKKPSKASVLSTLKYSFTLVLILCLFTVITNLKNPSNFNEYVSYAYASGRLGLNGVVAGGALFSALTFLAIQNLTFVGSIIFFSLVLLVDLVVIFKSAKKKKAIVSDVTEKTTQPIEQERTANLNAQPQNYAVPPQFNGNSYGAPNGYDNGYQPPFGNNPYNQPQGFNQAGYNGQNSFNTQSGYDSRQGFGHYGGFSVPQNNEQQSSNAPSREEAMRILYGNPRVYSEEYNNNFSTPRVNLTGENGNQSSFNNQGMVSNPISKEEINPSFTFEDKSNIKIYEEEPIDSFDNLEIEENLADKYKPESTFEYKSFFKDSLKESSERSVPLVNDDFADEEISLNTNDLVDGDPITKPFINEPINTTPSASTPIFKATSQDENTKTQSATIGEQYTKFLIENMPLNYKYTPPPQRLLKTSSNSDVDYQFEIFKAEIKNKILETLDNFGIKTQVARVFRGPAVTRFDVEVPATVPMSNITKRQGDINLRIAATSPIRMIAPVPGTPYVGIEVANNKRDVVTLKDIVSSDGFMNAEEHSITFALGKDVIGTPISLDVTKMPHLLIAGATGSGKSVCLNALIVSLLMRYSPEELRFIIVDPKGVEFDFYEKIPHLYFGEIVKDDIPMTNAVLSWVIEEMGRRYSEFSSSKVKDLKSYNKKARQLGTKIMPRIVMIIDEFADVMLKDKNGANTKICLLAQKSRAAGIHLILATQRPSVDIIEGPIKANLPSRIVFKVASNHDSMTCIGEVGAERLLGHGDGLYKAEGMFAYERFMGAYVSDEEIVDIVDFVKEKNDAYFDYNAWSKILASVNQSNDVSLENSFEGTSDSSVSGASGSIDQLNIKAMQIGYDFGGLSTSFLQRKLGVGYPRAAKIIDWLTDNGYITPNSVAGKKQMIMPYEEFKEKFGIGNGDADLGDGELGGV